MRLLVTGAAGMLGQAVVAHAERGGHRTAALTRAQLDVTDRAAVDGALDQARPEAVIHCAAWTHVDGAESAPARALAVNGDGAGHVAQAAAARGVRMVHVSTDYVFDGTGERPYLESDPTGPRSVYGESKLEGERQVLAAGGDHTVVRTSWLFGAGGRNFVDTMLSLGERRDEVSVVADQVGCPTWTGHLAPALIELAQRGAQGVYHVAGAGECSWNGLAVEAFEQAGVACRVLACTTESTGRPAPRPPYSVLRSGRPDAPVLPAWAEGVRGYLAERRAAAGRPVASEVSR